MSCPKCGHAYDKAMGTCAFCELKAENARLKAEVERLKKLRQQGIESWRQQGIELDLEKGENGELMARLERVEALAHEYEIDAERNKAFAETRTDDDPNWDVGVRACDFAKNLRQALADQPSEPFTSIDHGPDGLTVIEGEIHRDGCIDVTEHKHFENEPGEEKPKCERCEGSGYITVVEDLREVALPCPDCSDDIPTRDHLTGEVT